VARILSEMLQEKQRAAQEQAKENPATSTAPAKPASGAQNPAPENQPRSSDLAEAPNATGAAAQPRTVSFVSSRV